MIKILQLKEVLRNKRFISFTIIIPIFWFLLITKMMPDSQLNGYIALSIASLIGIIGNSITTFSKRINITKNYYMLQNKTSHYSISKFLIDQTIIQTLLNLLILVIMILIGSISISENILLMSIFIILIGWYFSFIGFFLGITNNKQALEALGFPSVMLGALTIFPFSMYHFENHFVKLVLYIQRIFPGYYLNKIMFAISQKTSLHNDVILFFVTIALTLTPLIISLKNKNK